MIKTNSSLYFDGLNTNISFSSYLVESLLNDQSIPNNYGLFLNQIYHLESHLSSFCIKVFSNGEIKKYDLKSKLSGIQGVDFAQKIALDIINDTEVSLVTCLASAGCGKTFITLASALNMLKLKTISMVYFIKPLVAVGNSKFLGTLPGGVDDKVAPFLDSFYDVAYSLGCSSQLEQYFAKDIIQFVPVDFIRGRNLDDCLVVVDEAQNLDDHELLSVLTRIGKNAKIILLGDPNPEQNDLRKNSGLMELISDLRYWQSKYTSCIHLKKRMRNPIVELAEKILLHQE